MLTLILATGDPHRAPDLRWRVSRHAGERERIGAISRVRAGSLAGTAVAGAVLDWPAKPRLWSG